MEKREKFFPNSSFQIKVNKKQNKDNSQPSAPFSCDLQLNKPQQSRNSNNYSKEKDKIESCYIINRLDSKNYLNLRKPPSSANNKEFKYKKINIINRYNKNDIKSKINNRQKYSCINSNKNNKRNIEIYNDNNNNDNETSQNYFMLRSETQYPLNTKKNYSDTLMANSNNSMRNLNLAYNSGTEKNHNNNITPKFKMNNKIDIRKRINNVNESNNYENNTFDKKVDAPKSENQYSNLTFNKLGCNFYKPTHKRINNNLENNNSPNPNDNKSNINNDIKSESRYSKRAYLKGNLRKKETQQNYNNTININNYNMKETDLKEKEKSEKKLITIYRTKLITIFVSLMNNICNKYKKKAFSELINKLKNNAYNNNVENKKFKKNRKNYYYIKKNKVNDNNLQDNSNDDNNFTRNYTKIIFNNKNLPPIAMYRKVTNNNQHSQLIENKDIRSIYKNSTMSNFDLSKSSSTNIYIPVKKRNRFNFPSKQKESIFDELKINKSYKFIDDNPELYHDRNININSQINHFYNTNNNNFYINRINSFHSIISLEKQRPHHITSKNFQSESSNDISFNNKIDKEEESKKAIKCSIFKNKSKFQNILYKKIFPNEKLQKSEKKRNDKVNVFMKRMERLCNKDKEKDKDKNNQNQTYSKRRIIKDGSKSNYNYYYSNFNYTLENNEVNELSNDVNNYCLEDIDKPTNMMYSKTNIINFDNDDGNFYNEENSEEQEIEIKNLMQIITNDKRLFLNFNYISLNNNNRNNSKRSKNINNILSISEINSLCFICQRNNDNIIFDNNNDENDIDNYSFKEDSNTLRKNLNKFSRKRKLKSGLLKLENIINNKIYEYKLIFFGLLKQLKFIFIINKIIENRSIDILKKYFDRFKNNLQLEMNDSFSEINNEMNTKKLLDKQNINHIIDDNKNTDIIQNKEKLKSLIKHINKNSRNKFQNNLKDFKDNILSEEERNDDNNSGNINSSLSLGKPKIYNNTYKKLSMSNSKSIYSKKKISVKNICELNDFDIFEKKIENFRLNLIKFGFFEK